MPNPVSKIQEEARRRNVRAFRGFLAEDYDGIGQYIWVNTVRASQTVALRAHIPAGDFATGSFYPEGTPCVLYSKHGKIEVLSLGQARRLYGDETPDEPLPGFPPPSVCVPPTIRQSKTSNNAAGFSLDSAVLPTSFIIVIGIRQGNGASPSPNGAVGGMTQIAQVQATDFTNNHAHTARDFAYKEPATTYGAGPYGFNDGAHYRFSIYEIDGGDINNISVLTSDENDNHHFDLCATLDIGTFTGAKGVAMMIESVSRSTDQASVDSTISMPSPWNERFDGNDGENEPWTGIGDATVDGDLHAAWDWCRTGNQRIGKWCGIAVLANCVSS